MSSSLLLISDHSKEKLQEVPTKVLEMTNLKMLFLEGNFLFKLPEDFFWKLPKLVWLDLRNNQLESVPKSIAHHEYLENLLLTNNNLKKLPNELGEFFILTVRSRANYAKVEDATVGNNFLSFYFKVCCQN